MLIFKKQIFSIDLNTKFPVHFSIWCLKMLWDSDFCEHKNIFIKLGIKIIFNKPIFPVKKKLSFCLINKINIVTYIESAIEHNLSVSKSLGEEMGVDFYL